MSALGHKQTFAVQKVVSALSPKADMCGATGDVCYGPIADKGNTANSTLFDHLVGDSFARHFLGKEIDAGRIASRVREATD
jgi:hypothetical protein